MRVVVLFALICYVTAGPTSLGQGGVSSSHSQGSEAPGRDSVTWNQSQHGKYNVQVSLKDVKIIAVINSDYYDDDDDDTDYEYDYEALLSSTKPTTAGPEVTEEVEEVEEGTVTSESSISSTEKSATNASESEKPLPILLTFIADGKPENITQLPNDPDKRAALAQLYHRERPVTAKPQKIPSQEPCEQGFFRDILGRCRPLRLRRRPSFFPFKFNLPGFSDLRLARRQAAKKQQYRRLQQILAPYGRDWQLD